MKKISILSCLMISCFFSVAQIHFGVKAGYNNSRGIYNSANNIHAGKSIHGFQFGLFAERKITGPIQIGSNLLFTQKGNYVDYSDKQFPYDYNDRRTYRLNYLEADISLLYKIKIAKSTSVKFGIGPYAAVGLSGKETGHFYWFGNSGDINRKIKFSNEKAKEFNQTYFNPIEWGLNFKGSFIYKKYLLYINYGRGIGPRVLTRYAGNESGNKFGTYEADTKNSVVSIGAGFYIK